jgi:hypothetical protein
MAKISEKKLLKLWMDAWETTDKTNPLGIQVEAELNKNKISTWDIRTRLGIIKSKKIETITDDEESLVEFYNRANHLREMILNDRVSRNIQGQMFLLKTQFGYTETQKIETSGTQSVVLDFGSDE